jgi:hypothetical protein
LKTDLKIDLKIDLKTDLKTDSVLKTESVCRRAKEDDPGALGEQQEARPGVAVPRKNWTFDDDVSM